MGDRADRKLDAKAVESANAAVGNRKLHPTDPADAADRKKWMDAYKDAGGSTQSTSAGNDEVAAPAQPCPKPCIDLEYLHSDGTGVAGAAYKVESVDINGEPDGFYETSGTLDGDGKAHIADVPEFEQFRYYFDSDPAPLKIKEEKEPQAKPDEEAAESFLDAVTEWIWGTVQGDFNKEQSFSQIAVNTVLGVIPIVDQVLDLRDIFAGLIDIIEYYSESEEEQDKHEDQLGLDYEFWIWVNLFIIAVGSIPIVGSVVKGVLKAVLVALKKLGKLAGDLSPQELRRLWELIVSTLNSFGVGNAHQWLKEFPGKLDGWLNDAAKVIKKALDALTKMFDAMQGKAWLLGKERAAAVVQKLTAYKRAIGIAYNKLDAMKAKVNTWFKEQIDTIVKGAHKSEARGAPGTASNPNPAQRIQTEAEPPDLDTVRPKTPTQIPSHLTSHPNAHTLARHGGAVTDDQLIHRARTGIAPDGSTLAGNRLPPLSSAFHSDDALLKADSVLRSGRLQQEIAANPGATTHTIKYDVGEDVGRGYARLASGNPNNVGKQGPLQLHEGLTHVQATLVKNPTTGVWETITMFPALP